jgi:hypothetical protein
MAMDAKKGMTDAQIMKQIIKDATKGLKGEEKQKVIRDLFVKVMPKPKGMTNKKKTTMTTKKMTAAKGGMAKKTKYMAKGGATKKTKYMAKGGAAKKK